LDLTNQTTPIHRGGSTYRINFSAEYENQQIIHRPLDITHPVVMDDIAFPRGGRPSAAKAMMDGKKEEQQLKRRERPSEIKKKRKAEKESPDFLFGSKATPSESTSSMTKSKKTKTGHGSTRWRRRVHSAIWQQQRCEKGSEKRNGSWD
jgi:hypothetical protein